MEISIEKKDVTPKIATEYLSKNFTDNRNLRNAIVDKYADDMISGRWLETGETIKFDKYGNLIDGQHRLQAVIKSGKTIPFFVAYGIDDSATINIDIGVKRSAADALKVSGHQENLQAKGTLAKRIILYNSGKSALTSTTHNQKVHSGTRQIVTVSQIVEYIDNNDLSKFCRDGQRLYAIQVSNILSPSDWIFLSWLLPKVDAKNADAFLEKLATLDGVSGESPIKSLFKKLQERLSGSQKMAEILASFDAYVAGKARYRVTHKNGARVSG